MGVYLMSNFVQKKKVDKNLIDKLAELLNWFWQYADMKICQVFSPFYKRILKI